MNIPMAALLFVAFFLSSFHTVCEVRAHFQWMKSRERKSARSSDVRIWKHKWSMPIGQAIVMRPSDFLQKCKSWNMLKNSALATWSGGPEVSTVQSHRILHLRRKATLPRHQILCTTWQTHSKVATKSVTQNSTQNEWNFHYSVLTIPDGSQTIPFSPHPAVPQTLLSPLWEHVLPGRPYWVGFCVSTIRKHAFRARRNENDAILQNLMQTWNWKKRTGHTE